MVLSKPQTNKVRSCVIIKEIEDGGEAEKWNNKRKPTLLQATLGYTVYTAMIKKKGNDSSRRRKTGVSEHKYTTRDNQIMIVAFQRAKG